jgi:mannose-6-phosphate isomerase-like protein (cupin superfamily)
VKIFFFRNEELQTSLTQIAIGKLKSGETVPFHLHKSMEEVFYILSGNETFYIDDEKIDVKKIMHKNTCWIFTLN